VLWFVAALSGVLQVAAYCVYIKKSHANRINPNPTSWFMWSYGTLIVLVLEFDRDAALQVLLLPAACALCSLAVAFLCWRNGTLRWPQGLTDKAALSSDIALTFAYAGAWLLLVHQLLSPEGREVAVVFILVCATLSTFVTFIPMVHHTWDYPGEEHWLPWAMWTLAYGLLGVTTLMSEAWTPELMLYPINCVLLHGAVAYLSRPNFLRARPIPNLTEPVHS
jgi:hypothetical protein